MRCRMFCFATIFCLAGFLPDSHAEDVLTLNGQVAPDLHWQRSASLPRDAVPFMTIKRSNGSFGKSPRTYFVVRAKVGGRWHLGSVDTSYISVDRGGGGDASRSIDRAKIDVNGKQVSVNEFEYLVTDRGSKAESFRWVRINGTRDENWTPAAWKVPANAIAAGTRKGLPVSPGRMPNEHQFGAVSPGVWELWHAPDPETEFNATGFDESKYVEFLVSSRISSGLPATVLGQLQGEYQWGEHKFTLKSVAGGKFVMSGTQLIYEPDLEAGILIDREDENESLKIDVQNGKVTGVWSELGKGYLSRRIGPYREPKPRIAPSRVAGRFEVKGTTKPSERGEITRTGDFTFLWKSDSGEIWNLVDDRDRPRYNLLDGKLSFVNEHPLGQSLERRTKDIREKCLSVFDKGFVIWNETGQTYFVRVATPPGRLNIAGRYERSPVENAWHRGKIVSTGPDSYQWKNAAGVVWKLTPDLKNNRLNKQPGSDYYEVANGKAFTLQVKDGRVQSFKHATDVFVRVGDL